MSVNVFFKKFGNNCSLSSSQLAGFHAYLGPYCHIETSNIQLDQTLDEKELHKICEEIECDKICKILEVSNRGVTDSQFKKIIYTLFKAKSSGILTVNLSRNQITDLGLRSVVTFLKKNVHIIKLDLSENNLGQESAQYLFEILQSNFKITDLNLDRNRICADSLKALQCFMERNIEIQKEISGAHYLKVSFFLEGVTGIPMAVVNNIVLKFCHGFSIEIRGYIRDAQSKDSLNTHLLKSKHFFTSTSVDQSTELPLSEKKIEHEQRTLLFSSEDLVVKQSATPESQNTSLLTNTKKKIKLASFCNIS